MALLTAALVAGGQQVSAAEWPQFRGSRHLGTSVEEGLLDSWGEGQPEVVWRRPIGTGYSAVSVAGGRLYTMDADGTHERVLCLDAATGETLWSVAAGEFAEAELGDSGPRATPAVVEGTVYAVTSRSKLLALAAIDGARVWERDLTELGPTPRFGYSTSPIVDGELVIVEVGDRDKAPGIAALDRRSGETRWASLEGPAGYSSALPVEIGGVRQYALLRRAGEEAVGLSVAGDVLWRFPTPGAVASIAMPVFVPPDRLFISTSDDTFGGHMIRISRSESGFLAEEVWSERLMRNHFNTSVAVDGHLYGFDNGTLRCLDAATGEKRWAKRGFGKGSVIAADGKLFVLGDTGQVALLEATCEAYTELGRLQVTEGRSWTAPSLAGGRLYLRDFDEIVSLDVSGAARAAAGEPEAPGGPVAARGGAVEPAPAPATVPAEMSVARILARYLEARGGAERWRELDALEIRGDLTVLSKRNPFRELRRKDDLFRLDYSAADAPAIKARDATGPWMLNAWLQPEVGRVTEGPYVAQLERESLFPLLLLDHEKKGIGVELVGRGRIDGVGTIDLLVTLPGGAEETWHLDAVTFREVAIDSRIYDFSQAAEPMDQRTFFDDFREVDGLVLPFRVDWEFNARLESMAVDEVLVDPEIDPAEFSPPSSPGR